MKRVNIKMNVEQAEWLLRLLEMNKAEFKNAARNLGLSGDLRDQAALEVIKCLALSNSIETQLKERQ